MCTETLPEFIAHHTVEKLCLPCKLVLPVKECPPALKSDPLKKMKSGKNSATQNNNLEQTDTVNTLSKPEEKDSAAEEKISNQPLTADPLDVGQEIHKDTTYSCREMLNEAEGFICPYCLVGFAISSKLQGHFVEMHSGQGVLDEIDYSNEEEEVSIEHINYITVLFNYQYNQSRQNLILIFDGMHLVYFVIWACMGGKNLPACVFCMLHACMPGFYLELESLGGSYH